MTWQSSGKPCWGPPVGAPAGGWSSWWSTSVSKGRVSLLPFEAQLTDEVLLPLMYSNLVVNSANEATEKHTFKATFCLVACKFASPENCSYHKGLAISWARCLHHLSGWASFTLYKKFRVHWVKERNLTLSPHFQDSPQGVLIPRAMEVTTHFAIKPTKKKQWKQWWRRDGVPGSSTGESLFTRYIFPQVFNYLSKPEWEGGGAKKYRPLPSDQGSFMRKDGLNPIRQSRALCPSVFACWS